MSTTANNRVPAESAPAPTYQYLWPKSKSNYKQLFVLGRIFPWTIHASYVSEEEPMTMEQIAEDWEIPLEAVQEAIAYYESKPPEMLADFRREVANMEARGMNDPDYKLNPRPKLLTPEQRAAIKRA